MNRIAGIKVRTGDCINFENFPRLKMFHHQSLRHRHLVDSITSFVMKFLKMKMGEKFGFMTQNPDIPKNSFMISITSQHWIAKMERWKTFGSLVLEI